MSNLQNIQWKSSNKLNVFCNISNWPSQFPGSDSWQQRMENYIVFIFIMIHNVHMHLIIKFSIIRGQGHFLLDFLHYPLNVKVTNHFVVSRGSVRSVAQWAPISICSNAYGCWFVPCACHSVRMTYRPSAALWLFGSLRISHNTFLQANKWILPILLKFTVIEHAVTSNANSHFR